jgi:hypothetical protein
MATLDGDFAERRNSTVGARGSHFAPSPIQLADLNLLANLLDARWKVPGTSIRFGVDALFGLVPVFGDFATGIASIYMVMRARELGAANGLIARMVGNVALDTVIGSIPVLGSIFDVYFKANQRNLRLLRRDIEGRRAHRS